MAEENTAMQLRDKIADLAGAHRRRHNDARCEPRCSVDDTAIADEIVALLTAQQPKYVADAKGYVERKALVVGYPNSGFRFYELDDAFNEAADLAESLGLMGADWSVGTIFVKDRKDG